MERLADWFRAEGRDLPWRRPPRDPWGVLVSEVMLQQTPVQRVEPVWRRWLTRWPDAAALAADSPAEAVRAWDRLGYPRRALRLHRTAAAIADRHGGGVPADYIALRALPGVGDYTAAAVLAFAFRRRIPVLDTNVRRVLARHRDGRAHPETASATAADRDRLAALLPPADEAAAELSEALMELGALVCTARAPACPRCPLADGCRWSAAGAPPNADPPSRQAPFAGSDRQVRGRIMDLLRRTPGSVTQGQLDLTWSDHAQLRRAQSSLLADGLLVRLPDGRYILPGG